MKVATLPDKLKLLADVCDVLNKASIHYLLYGSMAYNIITGENKSIGDIDFMVMQKDMQMVNVAILNSSLKFIPNKTEFTIHATSIDFLNDSGKPFEVTFDSYEHFFQFLNLNVLDAQVWNVGGVLVKVTKPEALIKTYALGLASAHKEKYSEYKRKVKVLESKSTSTAVVIPSK